MRVEPPGDAGKETAEAKGQKFIARGVNAGCSNSYFVLANSMKNNAGVRVGNLPHDSAQTEHQHSHNIIIGNASLGVFSYSRNTQLATSETWKSKNEPQQNDWKSKGC